MDVDEILIFGIATEHENKLEKSIRLGTEL